MSIESYAVGFTKRAESMGVDPIALFNYAFPESEFIEKSAGKADLSDLNPFKDDIRFINGIRNSHPVNAVRDSVKGDIDLVRNAIGKIQNSYPVYAVRDSVKSDIGLIRNAIGKIRNSYPVNAVRDSVKGDIGLIRNAIGKIQNSYPVKDIGMNKKVREIKKALQIMYKKNKKNFNSLDSFRADTPVDTTGMKRLINALNS